MPLPRIDPPLINTACPWASDEADLKALFDCPFTGAVTTRTSLLNGFAHDDTHQYTFFGDGSLNTLGYSPYSLDQYLSWVNAKKPCIISVTGTPDEVEECYKRICAVEGEVCMEINLSCPNIPGKPPPAYSIEQLRPYLIRGDVPVGLKLPPFTYRGQFESLAEIDCDFLTSTNTLGSSMVDGRVGGLAGAPIHHLSLGNVKMLHDLLDIDIIGVGGVSDRAGFDRMRDAGAKVVGLATALGREGVGVFEKVLNGEVKQEEYVWR